MNRKIIIGSIILIVIAASYILLGGFDKIKVEKVEVDNYVVVGMNYEGRYRSKELRNIFNDVKNKLDSGIVNGLMVVVNYNLDKDSLDNGFIRQFIGILIDQNESNKTLPQKYELINIETTSAIAAKISAHNLVMPSPAKIDQKIAAFAKANELKKMNLSIEKYVSERELIIEVPLFD